RKSRFRGFKTAIRRHQSRTVFALSDRRDTVKLHFRGYRTHRHLHAYDDARESLFGVVYHFP
ncbi:MAG: hypothetical protein ABSH45_08820, partial [Bryobacteraceae bacterium]